MLGKLRSLITRVGWRFGRRSSEEVTRRIWRGEFSRNRKSRYKVSNSDSRILIQSRKRERRRVPGVGGGSEWMARGLHQSVKQ